eukprot:INCI3177.3.p1 GENE.INCI3177.3~~INCI3177.3.p1  ORF type:complete len:1340 (-),score=254.32 INCI3177.3:1908-5927(-)
MSLLLPLPKDSPPPTDEEKADGDDDEGDEFLFHDGDEADEADLLAAEDSIRFGGPDATFNSTKSHHIQHRQHHRHRSLSDDEEEDEEDEELQSDWGSEDDDESGNAGLRIITPVTYNGRPPLSDRKPRNKKSIDASAELIALVRRLLSGDDAQEKTDSASNKATSQSGESATSTTARARESKLSTGSGSDSSSRASGKSDSSYPNERRAAALRRKYEASQQRMRDHRQATLKCIESSRDIVAAISVQKALHNFEATTALRMLLEAKQRDDEEQQLEMQQRLDVELPGVTGPRPSVNSFHNRPGSLGVDSDTEASLQQSIGSMDIGDEEEELNFDPLEQAQLSRRNASAQEQSALRTFGVDIEQLDDRTRSMHARTRSYARRGMSATAALLPKACVDLSCFKVAVQFLSLSPATESTPLALVQNRIYIRAQLRRRQHMHTTTSLGIGEENVGDAGLENCDKWVDIGETECALLPPRARVYSFAHCPLLCLPTADLYGPSGSELRLTLVCRTFTRHDASMPQHATNTSMVGAVDVTDRVVGVSLVDLAVTLQRVGECTTLPLLPQKSPGTHSNEKFDHSIDPTAPLGTSISVALHPLSDSDPLLLDNPGLSTSNAGDSQVSPPNAPARACFRFLRRGFTQLESGGGNFARATASSSPEGAVSPSCHWEEIHLHEQLKDGSAALHRDTTAGLLLLFIDRIQASAAALERRIQALAAQRGLKENFVEVETEIIQLQQLHKLQSSVLVSYGQALHAWYAGRKGSGSNAGSPTAVANVVLLCDALHASGYCQVVETFVEPRANVPLFLETPSAPQCHRLIPTVVFGFQQALPHSMTSRVIPKPLREVLHRYHARRLDSTEGSYGVEAVQATLDAHICGTMPPSNESMPHSLLGNGEHSFNAARNVSDAASPVQIFRGMSRAASVDPLFRVGGVATRKRRSMLTASPGVQAVVKKHQDEAEAKELALVSAALMAARDRVFVSVVNVAVVSFVETARVHCRSKSFWRQLRDFGLLLLLESLLSTRDAEAAALEDLVLGQKMLRRVRLQVVNCQNAEASNSDEHVPRAATATALPTVQVEFADRERRRDYLVKIDPRAFDCPPAVFAEVAGISENGNPSFSCAIVPVLLTQGIDAAQAFANRVGYARLQSVVNINSLAILSRYCQSVLDTVNIHASSNLHGGTNFDESSYAGIDIDLLAHVVDDLEQLRVALSRCSAQSNQAVPGSQVNVQMLVVVRRLAELLRAALAVTSGDDPSRASMVLSLHEVVHLVKDWGLRPSGMNACLQTLRLCGVHRDLVARTSVDTAPRSQPPKAHYAFDIADLQNLPGLLRPPIEATAVTGNCLFIGE